VVVLPEGLPSRPCDEKTGDARLKNPKPLMIGILHPSWSLKLWSYVISWSPGTGTQPQ